MFAIRYANVNLKFQLFINEGNGRQNLRDIKGNGKISQDFPPFFCETLNEIRQPLFLTKIKPFG